ncbi:MAG: SIS domain-containing protein [bacterium]|nr:SIS domain-containing protein [bacterium]
MTYSELADALAWTPKVEGNLPPKKWRVVVGGMGGSALPAHAARFLDPAAPVCAHRDYDLPEDAGGTMLYIAISYSGNTEETLSFARAALEQQFALAVIASGGELLALAKSENLPHVAVPGGMQPRNALFHQLRALLAVLGRNDLLDALTAATFDHVAVEAEAAALAGILANALPIFYASRKNGFLAWVAKIQTNESAKMPACANVFPELNHNEMQSFDTPAPEAAAALARFVLLHDPADDARIGKRMQVFAELMRERGRSVTDIALTGASRAEMLARTWFFVHQTALALAVARGVNPEAVPLVEAFKKRL